MPVRRRSRDVLHDHIEESTATIESSVEALKQMHEIIAKVKKKR
jgi:hypothetical protein